MKLPLSWLHDHLDTSASLEEIAEKLTEIGLEVEQIHDPQLHLASFHTALVQTVTDHPSADRLRVCQVETAEGSFSVVCGAPNVHAGMKAVFAPVSSIIPGTGVRLAKSTIRGVESHGMLLSERELGLSGEHDGIIALPCDTPVGTPVAVAMGLTDPVISLSVTPNRSDCLSIYGIARDLAAAGLGTLRDSPIPPSAPALHEAVSSPFLPAVVERDHDLCPAFALCLIRNVQNRDSPEWVQHRLRAIGSRPVNAAVDVTNISTFDRGRPLHVFDADKIRGNIVIRFARDGEEFLALDRQNHRLSHDIPVIADDDGIMAIAGIIGGDRTKCDHTTQHILLESALWNTACIARAGRRIPIASDARHHFERGVDPAFLIPGIRRAAAMITERCGGHASPVYCAGSVPDNQHTIIFNPAKIQRLSGIIIPSESISRILLAIGCQIRSDPSTPHLFVTTPSWRHDLRQEVDLVEEVVRITGIHHIPSTPLPAPLSRPAPLPSRSSHQSRQRHVIRSTLASRGMMEALTWSFIPASHALHFAVGHDPVVIKNPIASDMSHLRPNLFPGLIAAAKRNLDRGTPDLALFEIGPVFRGTQSGDQICLATGLRRGLHHLTAVGRDWYAKNDPVDPFTSKSDVIAVLESLHVPIDQLHTDQGAAPWFHPGRSGTLRMGPQITLAHFGELHPDISAMFDISGPLVGFEIFVESLPAPRARSSPLRPPCVLNDLQPLKRDFAFVVDTQVKAQDIVRAARSADRKHLVSVRVFDVFQDDRIGRDKVSIAIEVTLQPLGASMTEDQIEEISRTLVAKIIKATGGSLRG